MGIFSPILWLILLSQKIMCTFYHKHTNVGPWLGWRFHKKLRLSLFGPANWKCGIQKSLTHLWSQAEVKVAEQPCSTCRESRKFTRAERKTGETERTGTWHILVLCFLVGVGIFFFVSFLLFETGSYHVVLDGLRLASNSQRAACFRFPSAGILILLQMVDLRLFVRWWSECPCGLSSLTCVAATYNQLSLCFWAGGLPVAQAWLGFAHLLLYL